VKKEKGYAGSFGKIKAKDAWRAGCKRGEERGLKMKGGTVLSGQHFLASYSRKIHKLAFVAARPPGSRF